MQYKCHTNFFSENRLSNFGFDSHDISSKIIVKFGRCIFWAWEWLTILNRRWKISKKTAKTTKNSGATKKTVLYLVLFQESCQKISIHWDNILHLQEPYCVFIFNSVIIWFRFWSNSIIVLRWGVIWIRFKVHLMSLKLKHMEACSSDDITLLRTAFSKFSSEKYRSSTSFHIFKYSTLMKHLFNHLQMNEAATGDCCTRTVTNRIVLFCFAV